MTFGRFPSYRPVSMGWANEIPAQWDAIRLRFVATLNPSKSEISHFDRQTDVTFVPMEAVGEDGGLDRTRSKPLWEVESGYTYFRDGDVIVAKITPCFENGKATLAAGLINGIGFGSTEFHVLRPGPKVYGRFLFYLLSSSVFRTAGTGNMIGAGGQKRVPAEFVADFRVPLPPTSEQRAIVDFLDLETAKIDALIEKQEALIKLIDERHLAIRERIALRGVSRDVGLEDSSVAWIGKIPASWQVVRAKVIFCEIDDRSDDGSEELLTVSHLTGVTRRADKDVTMFLAESNEGYKRCTPGDLAVNTMWAWMGAMGVSGDHGIVSPSYAVYRQRRPVFEPKFLDVLVRSPSFVAEVNRHSKGIWSSRLRLYPEAFLDLRLPVPPLGEQRAILAELDRRMNVDRHLSLQAKLGVQLLKERRTALIAAAITGQIDVRATPVLQAAEYFVPATEATEHNSEPVETRKQAPPEFRRAVLAAEIVHLMHQESTFGAVKAQKALYLCEQHLGMSEVAGTYHRHAAGPHDNRMMRSVESQLRKQRWYDAVRKAGAVKFRPLAHAGQHRKYLDRYWPDRSSFDALMLMLKSMTTQQAEIVATLYAAWNDFLLKGVQPSDDIIVNEVLNNWHDSKRRISEQRWQTALDWMRKKDLVPRGTGSLTQTDRLT